MTTVKNWLLSEYAKVGIEGLRIASVMRVLTDTLEEIKKTDQYRKQFKMSKNLSVLLYKTGDFEVHINIKNAQSTYSTYQTFKMNEAKPLEQELEDMAKINALGTYLSSDVADASQYDEFMKLESIEGEVAVWEPFEYTDIDRLKELIEDEFTSTLHSFQKIAQLAQQVEVNVYGYEERREAIDADLNECPVCGSQDIDYGEPDPDSVFIYREHKCKGCGFEYQERYVLERVESKDF